MSLLSPDFTENDNELLGQSHAVEDSVGFLLAGDDDGAVWMFDGEHATLAVEVDVVAAAKCHDVAPWL